jgi:hypothetical protein
MHLAATVGTPCVAIFAARNISRVWYPHGKQHWVTYHQVNCMGCGLVVHADEQLLGAVDGKQRGFELPLDDCGDRLQIGLVQLHFPDGSFGIGVIGTSLN